MKKHLALLCGIYYPNPSPTGLCAKHYAELLKNEYDIEIIFMQTSAEEPVPAEKDGFFLHGICGRRLKAEYKARGAAKRLLHLLGQAEIKTRIFANMSWYRRAALEKLNELHSRRPLDAVLSVCSPFAAHAAGADFKRLHQEICHAAYTVDPYSSKNRVRPFFMTYAALAAFERDVLAKADYLLLSEEIYKTRPDLYEGAKQCSPLPYVLPPFYETESGREFFDENGIHCVYAGRFYEDIRNPEYMLKAFSALKDKSIKLHLFSTGCEKIVKSYAENNPNIIIHPTVTQDKIRKVYAEADILIGVGNTLAEFMPSKTYEYIVSRKPIVFFNQGSSRNEALEAYPCAKQLYTAENTDKSAAELERFVTSSRGAVISREAVEKAYEKNMPSHIAKILLTALNSRIN